ncbi:MAG: hypothetical protein ACREQ5_22525 [Candidatus Dormibacteria bacterium]
MTALNAQIKTLKQELKDSNNAAIAQREAADKAAADITAKYKDELKKNESLSLVENNLIVEKIKHDKELAAVKLSLNAVKLFNASKQPVNSGSSVQASPTVSGDAQVTSPSGKIVTLQDLFIVSAHNDKSHLDCISQVEQWQAFWNDVTTKYDAALNGTGNAKSD